MIAAEQREYGAEQDPGTRTAKNDMPAVEERLGRFVCRGCCHLALMSVVMTSWLAVLPGCASVAPAPLAESNALVMVPVSQANVVDERARFRDVFCTVLRARVDEGYRAGSCEEHLLRLSDEPSRSTQPVSLDVSNQPITVIFVAGLFLAEQAMSNRFYKIKFRST